MEATALYVAAASALFSALAAGATFFQASKASEANEVSVYLSMLDVYGASEMRTAIANLAAFRRSLLDREVDVGTAFQELASEDPDAATALRGYSRQLSAYFVNAARLQEGGLISRKLLRLLISHPGLNVFYEVAVPINLSKNPHHNSGRYARILKHVVIQHGDGIF